MYVQEGKIIKSSSGFSGKGFKFDETEHALANERKKLQKAALGLHDSDDEDTALDVSVKLQCRINILLKCWYIVPAMKVFMEFRVN